MKNIYKPGILAVVSMFLLALLLSACERTELCYDHYPRASLSFDWELEWERDYGNAHRASWDADYYGFIYDNLRPAVPEWVNLEIYKDGEVESENYMSPSGGDIVLVDKGERSFLLYNGDTEFIVLSDMASITEARASASPRSRAASMNYILERHPDTRSANPPDLLYAAFIKSVPEMKAHESTPLAVKMQPLVYTYVIRYEFEYGLQRVRQARGALAGMAESVYLRDGRTSDESVIVLYDCEVKKYGCEAIVRSFGVPGFPDEYYGRSSAQAPNRPFTLNLEVLLTNGKVEQFNFDVEDQLKKQPRGGVITVKGIRIEDDEEEPEENAGGFDVDLSGWGEVNIDLPVGPA